MKWQGFCLLDTLLGALVARRDVNLNGSRISWEFIDTGNRPSLQELPSASKKSTVATGQRLKTLD